MVSLEILFAKLVLAHLLGDFILQTNQWTKQKEKYTLGSIHLYLHVFIHMGLTLLFVWRLDFWPYIILIGVSHLFLDTIKSKKQVKRPVTWFIADQALHIFILLLIALHSSGKISNINQFIHTLPWVVITGYVFVTLPVSIIIKKIISPWQPKDEENNEFGVINAGKFIGIVERVLILIFLAFGQWQAIGFLLTAKSVFRFKDISNTKKEMPLTEYILLGTLLSFGFAIATGWLLYYA